MAESSSNQLFLLSPPQAQSQERLEATIPDPITIEGPFGKGWQNFGSAPAKSVEF